MRLSPADNVQADAMSLCCHILLGESQVWWGISRLPAGSAHAAAWHTAQLVWPSPPLCIALPAKMVPCWSRSVPGCAGYQNFPRLVGAWLKPGQELCQQESRCRVLVLPITVQLNKHTWC